MPALSNICGTTSSSFTIGGAGITIYSGIITPKNTGLAPNNGDLYIQNSSPATIWQFSNNVWAKYALSGAGVPVGFNSYWSSNNIPQNWLVRDGSNFNTQQYPDLVQIFPSGQLNDDRGLFLRGYEPS